MGGDVIHVTIDSAGDVEEKTQTEKAEALLEGLSYVEAVTTAGNGLKVTVRDGTAAAPDLLRLLHGNQVSVTNLSIASPTLDDVFLKYTGREIRSEEASGDEVGQMMRPWLGLNRSIASTSAVP